MHFHQTWAAAIAPALLAVAIRVTPPLHGQTGGQATLTPGVSAAIRLPNPVIRELSVPAERLEIWGTGALSPDGRFVAFRSDSVPKMARNLEIRDQTTGVIRRLVSHTATEGVAELSWSKDSRQIAYTWCTPKMTQPPVPAQCDIRIIDRDGKNDRVLLSRSEGEIEVLEWSPDGRRILAELHQRPTRETYQLALISTSDGSVRGLTTGATQDMENRWGGTFGMSPDGRYVAFSVDPYEKPSDIFIVPTDGGEERALMEHPSNDRFVGWTPSGRSVLFTSDRSGSTDLWLARVTDGRVEGLPVMVKENIGVIEPRRLTATGALYYVEGHVEPRDIYVVSLDSTTGRITSSPELFSRRRPGRNESPVWSPDGKQLAYRSAPPHLPQSFPMDGFNMITIATPATGEERELFLRREGGVHGWHGWTLAWAPDRRSFLVSVNSSSSAYRGLFIVNAETGETTTLRTDSPPGTYVTGAQWLPDGRSIVFLDHGKVILRNVEDGQQRILYDRLSADAPNESPIWGLALSPDGRQLALWRGQARDPSRTLMVMDLADGRARSVAELAWNRPSYEMAWSPDGRFLFYLRKSGPREEWELWRQPAAGGPSENLGMLAASQRATIWSFSLRPDGRALAFDLIRGASTSLFVLENFLPEIELAPRKPIP